jgi:hypothetical protein
VSPRPRAVAYSEWNDGQSDPYALNEEQADAPQWKLTAEPRAAVDAARPAASEATKDAEVEDGVVDCGSRADAAAALAAAGTVVVADVTGAFGAGGRAADPGFAVVVVDDADDDDLVVLDDDDVAAAPLESPAVVVAVVAVVAVAVAGCERLGTDGLEQWNEYCGGGNSQECAADGAGEVLVGAALGH